MVDKEAKSFALVLAKVVRNGLEDLHAKGIALTDENMPKVNKAIRDSIFQWATIMREFKDNPKELEKFLRFVQPESYRETNNFKKIEENVKNMKLLSLLGTQEKK